jgi:aminomethyltransferase
MRASPLHELLASRGAAFGERAGAEVALRFGDPREEYRAVREAVGLSDMSFTTRFSVPEEGLDLLERYAAGAVSSIRFGRVLHTFAADEGGLVESDLYIANDDTRLLVLGESLVDDRATAAVLDGLGAAAAGSTDLAARTAVIGIDGCRAFAVARELFGADVLGLPYLAIETYPLLGEEVRLIRAGKTSEFGYLLLVPAGRAADCWLEIERAGAAEGIRPVGAEAHAALRLDGRFFNVHAEGAAVRDPLPLGLQWMIDFEGEDFRGREAILARREAGLRQKIVGVAPADPAAGLEPGDPILLEGETVAEVICAADSGTLGHRIGLALFDIAWAFSGLTFGARDGGAIRTISMPPFMPRSLTVKLDEQ